MLSCWRLNPEKRPKFNDLEKCIGKILGTADSEQYTDLNEPYMKANKFRFNSGETDYLALQGAPNSQAPSVPVNALREKYFPFLSKMPGIKIAATNGLEKSAPKLSKQFPKTLKQPITLRTFKTNSIY